MNVYITYEKSVLLSTFAKLLHLLKILHTYYINMYDASYVKEFVLISHDEPTCKR